MRWSLATVALLPRGVTAHANAAEQRRVMAWAAAAGFHGLEISPQWLNIDDLPPSDLARFRREAGEAGLTISGINVNRCLFTRGTDGDEQLARIRRALEAASILGTKCVTLSLSLPLAGSNRPVLRGAEVPAVERDLAAARLADLARQAAADHIKLSLELHDDGLLDTAEYCLDMVRRVDDTNVGVNPDLGNLIRTNPAAPWRTELELLAPLANNWHVKNYRGGAVAPLWEGQIDYPEALRIMRRAGYTGWVSIESYAAEARALQEGSLNYLRQLERQLAAEEQEAAV